MAGDWIKMRSNLWDDPRIARLVDMTDSSEAAVIGGLYWLWATADQHSDDGVMHGMQPKTIDRKTGVAGLGEALISIGWIADFPEGIHIVRFGEHNGKSAKARIQTAKRVSKHEANAKLTPTPLEIQGEGVSKALPRVREEEEKNKNHHSESSVDGAPKTAAENTAENATRKGNLCKQIKILGIDAAPHLAAWAEILPAFSDDEILSAAEKARDRKPGERISLNYLLPILRDKAIPKAPKEREVPWWSSNDLMVAKGRSLGLDPRPGEDWPQFRGRINAKLADPMEKAA